MKRKTFTSVLVTVLVMAVAATAYFFVASTGEGTHTAELGRGTAEKYPIGVAFAAGLTPGQSEGITFTLEPAKATTIKSLTVTPSIDETHAKAGCEAKWFVVKTSNSQWSEILAGTNTSPVTIPAGKYNPTEAAGANFTLEFVNTTGTNQSACEGASLSIKATSST